MAEDASPAPNSGRCVYGFALLVLSSTCFLLYVIWAVVPSDWLLASGLGYFSSKYYALAFPTVCCVSIALFGAFIYPAIILILTERPDCINVLIDSHSRHQQQLMRTSANRKGIPPIWDMNVEDVSRKLYYSSTSSD